jgi:20S proteasome subunit beta 6
MQADAATLHKVLSARLCQYEQRHHRTMSTPAIAQLLSNTLYYKRFFPYYTFNVLGGLDEEGKGAVYGYDAIGSFERIPYGVTGSASALITSILDNQVEFKTAPKMRRQLSLEETLDLVRDVYTSAGERDIYTGDTVHIAIITQRGITVEKFALKKD